MERLSSSLFMLSLMVYYIGKIVKIKKLNYIKAHIIVGTISVLAMVGALMQRIGQPDFIKYIGFALIMILIGITGYFIRKNKSKYRLIHIIMVLLFFVYLFLSIKLL